MGRDDVAATAAPPDADERRRTPAVVAYPVENLPPCDMALYGAARAGAEKVAEVIVPPRDARAFRVPAGHFFRIACTEGPQVGDLNLWNATISRERFFSGKTRALHATHVTTGDRLWSHPALICGRWRPITHDTLAWYGLDADGAGVHDVIGTRCDPYTNRLLERRRLPSLLPLEPHPGARRAPRHAAPRRPSTHVHDVLNVFMCTGFTRDTHQYFMKASPVRPGDYIEFFAEIDLLAALSACPGGDCSASHSSDEAPAIRCWWRSSGPRRRAPVGTRPSQRLSRASTAPADSIAGPGAAQPQPFRASTAFTVSTLARSYLLSGTLAGDGVLAADIREDRLALRRLEAVAVLVEDGVADGPQRDRSDSRRSGASVKYSLSVQPTSSKHADMAGLAANKVPPARTAATSFGAVRVIREILHFRDFGRRCRLAGRIASDAAPTSRQ